MVSSGYEAGDRDYLEGRLNEMLRGNLQPPGTIMLFAGQVPPDDWGICDGAEMERAVYPRLFEVLGEKFGPGDGETTFNLPDLPGPQPGIRYIIRLGMHIPAQNRRGKLT